MATADKLARWKADPVTFIGVVLMDAETGRQFALSIFNYIT
jgi:hypothetical protein